VDAPVDLAELPTIPERRVAVRVTPDALRQIRGGHPWVFDRAVSSVSHDAPAGALAVVFDQKRRFAAIGLWDPDSPIRVRVLHAGDPTAVDGRFWRERIASALQLRNGLIDDPTTTGYRCVHGENDGLPGLVIDRYDDTGVMKLYTAAWHPHLRPVVEAFVELTGVRRMVLRHSRAVAASAGSAVPPTSVLLGDPPPDAVRFLEHGLHFDADVLLGQKTGHFLDQRDNRALVGELAAGARVLDVFCCTGGFSVHAAAGGAASVTSVDRSAPALEATRRNLALNAALPAVAACRHDTIEGDAFEVLERLGAEGRRYDVVVIDPPSFASRAAQVDRAVTAYATLTRMGIDLVAAGGMLVQSSCSSRVDQRRFHTTVREAAHGTGRSFEEWARTAHAADHPVGFPEGQYLKTAFARIGA
jgi:23S rRNA (cytosine1962-C5)-methyltransferase